MAARAERQPKPATVDQPRSRRRRPGTRRFRWATAAEIALLTLAAVIVAFPLFFMVTSGLKHEVDIFSTDLSKVVNFAPTLDNFRDVFSTTSEGLELYQNFLNSVIVAGGATLLATGLGVPAAWAYSRLKPRGSEHQLFFILSTRMMPAIVVLVPIFIFYQRNWTGLHDTYIGLILLYTAFNLPFTIWMMKGFIDQVPQEYEDAAMVDGYSRVEAFWRGTLALLVPGIAATGIFAFIFSWNEFVFVTFLAPRNATTVPAAIAKLPGSVPVEWGLIAAASVVFAIPVLIFAYFVRRNLVSGFTLGSVHD